MNINTTFNPEIQNLVTSLVTKEDVETHLESTREYYSQYHSPEEIEGMINDTRKCLQGTFGAFMYRGRIYMNDTMSFIELAGMTDWQVGRMAGKLELPLEEAKQRFEETLKEGMLVHEYQHVLQYRQQGDKADEWFANYSYNLDCTFHSEMEAYCAQYAYTTEKALRTGDAVAYLVAFGQTKRDVEFDTHPKFGIYGSMDDFIFDWADKTTKMIQDIIISTPEYNSEIKEFANPRKHFGLFGNEGKVAYLERMRQEWCVNEYRRWMYNHLMSVVEELGMA